jgi:anti-sigma factor RsiW
MEDRKVKKATVMKCEELLALLSDYVDGAIDPSLCREFEEHMHGCNPCQVVVDNIRKTITLYKAGEPYRLPVTFRDQLHDVLRKRWSETRDVAGAGGKENS